MHDGNELDCGYYVSDVFDSNTGIWLHYDDENITEISDKEINVRLQKKMLVVYTRLIQLISSISVLDTEFYNTSKINHTKEVSKDLNVFEREFKARQDVCDEIQTSISFIEDEIKTYIEKVIYLKKTKDYFGWIVME